METEPLEIITKQDLIYYRLIGDPNAKTRREKLGEILNIGYTNGKQLLKRLQMFQISRETFMQAMEQICQEEQING